ncbi:MAG: hypothetical protein JNM41_14340 [Flavipsychrobacter sp.]|nr:hypothetical protein [Flavipsychrobacter sp.]
MTKNWKYRLMPVVILCGLFFSCTQERQPCLTPKTAILKMKSVRKATDDKVLDTAFNAAVFFPMSPFVSTGTFFAKASGFTLSLSPLSDTCQWRFAPDTAAGVLYDTLTFVYRRQLTFVSNACGYSHFFELDTVFSTHHTVDSASILNRSVTNNVNTNHVQVFIRPRP